MTDNEIQQLIVKLKEIFDGDPYLGNTFISFRDQKAARNFSRYKKVSAIIEMAHLDHLLAHKSASEVMVMQPSKDDVDALRRAIEDLGLEYQDNESFRANLALLTKALQNIPT